MRKFSSYGPVDTGLHFYVPRQELIDSAVDHLVGENPDKGGHYMTVWAPRQRGKSWILQQAMWRIRTDPQYARFDVLKLNLEHLKLEKSVDSIVQTIAQEIIRQLALTHVQVNTLKDLYEVFGSAP